MRCKLFGLMMTLVFASILLTGCSFTDDRNHAAIAITTSNGKIAAFTTYNGANSTKSGEALAANSPAIVLIDEGETVSADFHCSECGMHETFEFETIGSHIVYCECPVESEREEFDAPSREYACILIGYRSQYAEQYSED